MQGTPTHLIACHECDLLIERVVNQPDQDVICPRCHARLYYTTLNTIERLLALSLAGLILFIPANLFPILSLRVFGQSQSEIILQSALSLYEGGLIVVALLILLFAIVVPLIQLIALFYISFTLHYRWEGRLLRQAMHSYQHLRGWGMLEIFLLGVLISIIKLKDIADLEIGLGLYSLAALIVVITLSSVFFNPHQIWHQIDLHRKQSRSHD
ncbi:paraquat-inducible protein A [Amphritea japonica]|uniref:Paraquat-inducible protein A n=1 Tax=Amphritea japonica ATCC BAA-1530 TaxID=1278309 RepID=A0A7R6STM6_9GAMM|nr:paraquat-inducible protein A [Amphritea japonica]BBB27460.1 paraquat-inducible protein A [Amphritea japonica ATCC BAA-1530]